MPSAAPSDPPLRRTRAAPYAIFGGLSLDGPAPSTLDSVVFACGGAGFSVTREPLAGHSFGAHPSHKVVQLSREAPDLDLLEIGHTTLAGRAAVKLRFSFRGPHGLLEQTTVLVEPTDEKERMVTTFSVTALVEHAESARRDLDALLETVRFDAESGEERVPETPSAPAMPKAASEDEFAGFFPMPGTRRR